MTKLLIILTALVVLSMSVDSLPKLNSKILSSPFMPRSPHPKREKPVSRSVVLNSLEQRIDHFNPQNLDTFEQRYYMNGEYFVPGGPIFIFVGGEWRIDPYYIEEGGMFDMARDYNGYMFYLEHRFYGESHPFGDLSLESLRFLNVDQAIHDLAHFCEHITNFYVTPGAENSPIILVGLHYSASIATWTRAKFPHLVEGVWASSAPLEARIDFHEFKDVAGAVYLSTSGPACYARIDDGFDQMEDLIENDMDELVDIFRLCYPLDTEVDQWIFFQIMGEVLSILATLGTVDEIHEICDVIAEGEDAVHGIANLVDMLIPDDILDCLPIDYDELIEIERDEDIDSESNQFGLRQFTYQFCTQFGWFHTSNSEFHPFGESIPLELFHGACTDIFGPSFNNETLAQNVDRFNVAFGGLNLAHISNIVYTYGMHDAWRILGIQERLNEDSDAIVIRGYGQTADLLSLTADDSIEMYNAKMRVRELVREWISDGVPS